MLMLWMAVAAQLSLPASINTPIADVRAVFSPDDMPAYVQIAGIDRFVRTRTTVRPDGEIQDCAVEGGSGDRSLDALTCSIIVQRAKLQPGTWLDGSPAYGVLRVPVSWVIGGPPPKSVVERAFPPDLSLSVNRLPNGAKQRTTVALVIAVDETGRVVSCDARPKNSKWDKGKTFPELTPIACEQLTSQFTAIPAKDASGKPVRSVQSALVEFAAGK